MHPPDPQLNSKNVESKSTSHKGVLACENRPRRVLRNPPFELADMSQRDNAGPSQAAKVAYRSVSRRECWQVPDNPETHQKREEALKTDVRTNPDAFEPKTCSGLRMDVGSPILLRCT